MHSDVVFHHGKTRASTQDWAAWASRARFLREHLGFIPRGLFAKAECDEMSNEAVRAVR